MMACRHSFGYYSGVLIEFNFEMGVIVHTTPTQHYRDGRRLPLSPDCPEARGRLPVVIPIVVVGGGSDGGALEILQQPTQHPPRHLAVGDPWPRVPSISKLLFFLGGGAILTKRHLNIDCYEMI